MISDHALKCVLKALNAPLQPDGRQELHDQAQPAPWKEMGHQHEVFMRIGLTLTRQPSYPQDRAA